MFQLATLVKVVMPAPTFSPSYWLYRSSPRAPSSCLTTSTGLSFGAFPLAANHRFCGSVSAALYRSKRSRSWVMSVPSGAAGGSTVTGTVLVVPGCRVGTCSLPGPSNSTTPASVYQRYHSSMSGFCPFHASVLLLVTVTSVRNALTDCLLSLFGVAFKFRVPGEPG